MKKKRCRHVRAPGTDGLIVYGEYQCGKCWKYVKRSMLVKERSPR